MAQVHRVFTKLVKVNPVGSVISENNSTIQENLNFSTDYRVISDDSIPNSQGWPTIAQYLSAEAQDFYLPEHVDQYTIVTVLSDISKIDSLPVDGLLGAEDSLAYKVEEIEKHLHNRERWYGMGGGGLAEENNVTPWVLTTGAANVFGVAVQLSDGAQFPSARFDMHRIFVVDANTNNSTYLIEFATTALFADADIITSVPYRQATGAVTVPIDAISKRQPTNYNLWARAKSENIASTIEILAGVHVYPG